MCFTLDGFFLFFGTPLATLQFTLDSIVHSVVANSQIG